jgi:hypothetical protein
MRHSKRLCRRLNVLKFPLDVAIAQNSRWLVLSESTRTLIGALLRATGRCSIDVTEFDHRQVIA